MKFIKCFASLYTIEFVKYFVNLIIYNLIYRIFYKLKYIWNSVCKIFYKLYYKNFNLHNILQILLNVIKFTKYSTNFIIYN
jgi:hypothetical protein